MPPKPLVGDGKVLFVPTFVAPLVAADQQDCHPARIKSEEHSPGITPELHPQFLHIGEFGILQRINIRSAKPGSMLPQQVRMGGNLTPQVGILVSEPCREIVIKLYIPFLGNSYAIQ
jgi:hypothetical protein